MRIDRFLYCIRLLKRRTLAQDLVRGGHVRINGRRIEKSADDIDVGAIIALPLHGKVRILKVVKLPNRRGPAAEARACYLELGIDEPKPAT